MSYNYNTRPLTSSPTFSLSIVDLALLAIVAKVPVICARLLRPPAQSSLTLLESSKSDGRIITLDEDSLPGRTGREWRLV